MDYVSLLQQLVAFPTVNNPAQDISPTRECPEFLEKQLTKQGLNAQILKQKGFFSVLATHGTGRPVTLFLAHFDVVPIGQGWNSDPFELTIRNEMGYGRGTADDKGNVVALLLTAEALAKKDIPGTIAFAMTGDEEIGGANGATIVRKTLEKENLFPNYLITADGVGMQIVTRRRNTCGITISVPKVEGTCQGTPEKHQFTTKYVGRQSRHSAYFLPGVDRHALLSASSFLLHHPQIKVSRVTGGFVKSNVVPDWFEIDGLNLANMADPQELPCDVNLTRLIQMLLPLSRIQFPTRLSDYGITLCPNLLYEKKKRWEVYFDGRAMTTDTEAVEAAIEAILNEKFHDIKYQTVVRMGKAFMNTPTDSTLVKTAQKIALKQNLKTQPIELGGASDTRHFSDRPIEAIDFGPIGFGVHGSNEHVVLESIPQTAQFYIQLALALHSVKMA